MSAITEPAQDLLDQVGRTVHPCCIVCGPATEDGLGLRFALSEDGGVEARFDCGERYQGYEGVLHGGVIASLLDGAMTNCLFAYGSVAVTAEMTVRFRHPLALNDPATVQARITRRQSPLYEIRAEILQGGIVKATAKGKFMQCP